MKARFQGGIVRVVLAAMLGGALFLPVGTALADPPGSGAPHGNAAPARAQVQVRVVLANNSGKVDPALKPLEAQLRFTKYTGFQQLSSSTAQLAEGADATFQVEGGRRLRVDLLDRTPTQAKVRVRLTENASNLLDTTVSIPRNKPFIIGGPKYNGGVLILPVTVSY
jgi:hypothetical protein